MKQTYYIIDFDSTFIRDEAMDLLADICMNGNPNRDKIIEQVQKITALGMEGLIPFPKSLKKRLDLLKPSRDDINQLIHRLKNNISRSVQNNKTFIKKNREQIFIVSGGFKEYIVPIVSAFDICPFHVLANTFRFDNAGNYNGYDASSPLSQVQGKIKAVRSLGLDGFVVVVGDGYTDYELKKVGVADTFVAFTENVLRKSVCEKADQIASSFDEFLSINRLLGQHD